MVMLYIITFTLTNCSIIPAVKELVVLLSSSAWGLLLYIFQASHNIYEAPIKVIRGFIDGIILYNVMLKKLLNTIIMKKPKNTPALNLILFLNPYLLALDIAIILLGPGVKVVIIT
jgi:hypothetical protein